MFGIGPMELAIILLVALLVLGPKRLPDVMKMMGRMMAELKKAAEDVKKEIVQEEDLKGIQESLREIGDVPRLVQKQLEKEVDDLAREEADKNAAVAAEGGPQEGETENGPGNETGPGEKPGS